MPGAEIETLKNKLQAARGALLQVAERIQDKDRPIADGWSVRDILAHVGAAEEVNVKLARLMVEQDNPVQIEAMAQDFPDFKGPFSLDSFNAYLTDKLRDLPMPEVLARLHRIRSETLAWLETLTPEQLERRGRHAIWEELNVRGMFRILALHDKTHTKDMTRGVENSQ